jgi:glyoxylase-like metal-dependent hydrolase (beta-lactamase superfamily II)
MTQREVRVTTMRPDMNSLPIAPDWFSRRSIGDDITLLWEPHVSPLLRCNIWHVRGRNCDLLIDTGLGVASLKAAATDLFDKSLKAVATHTHMDHIGSIHEFDTRYVHAAEAAAMADAANHLPLDVNAFDDATKHALKSLGYDISAGLLTAIPRRGFDIAQHRLQPARATHLLEAGDIIDMGNRAFEVLHLPGHSPGSIGLWEAKTGTLFSGDAIYDGPLLDRIPGADVAAYVRTMHRLRNLPVAIVHGGHDASFGRTRLIEIADSYLRRRERA